MPMSLTLGDLRAWVEEELRDTGNAHYTDVRIDQLVNEYLREAATRLRLLQKDQTFNLVASTPTYALPSDFVGSATNVCEFADGTTRYPIFYVRTIELIHHRVRSLAARRRPALWTLDDGRTNLRLFPTPSDSITSGLILPYVYAPTKLLLVTDTVAIPDEYGRYAVDMTCARLGHRFSPEKAASLRAHAEELVAQALQYAHPVEESPAHVMELLEHPLAITPGGDLDGVGGYASGRVLYMDWPP